MSECFEATVLAQPEAISALTDSIIDYLSSAGVDTRATHHVALATEEILTNLGTHGGVADSPTTVRISITPDLINGEIIDTGPFFDLRDAPDPNLTDDIAERQIGGLGLFLIRQFATHIDYARRDGANCTSFAIARNKSAQ